VVAAGLFQGCGGGAETANEATSLPEPSASSSASVTTFPESIPAKAVGATANDSETARTATPTTGTPTTETTTSPSSVANTTSAPSTTGAPVTTAAPTTSAAPETTPAPTTTQAAAFDAATAYLRRCGGCHGAEGTAQGAQTLVGVGELPESYVLETVMIGGGGMPSFGEWLDQAEIDAIVAYVRASF
jgi:cytochrome c553